MGMNDTAEMLEAAIADVGHLERTNALLVPALNTISQSAHEMLADIDDDATDGEISAAWLAEVTASALFIGATSGRARVLDDVLAERYAQDAKWGEQNHPDGTGPDTRPLRAEYGFNYMQGNVPAMLLARAFKDETDRVLDRGTVTFADIALEEVFEALAEDDPAKLRTELVQTAAVFVQWIEAIDRRTAGGVVRPE